MQINLRENTYVLMDEKTNSPNWFSLGEGVVDIHFLKKIFKAPLVTSGFLDDKGLVKTVLLLETSKNPFPLTRILAGQLSKIIPKLECRYRIFPFSFKSVKPNARPGFDPVVRRSGQLLQSPQSPAAGIRFPLRPVAVRWVAGAGRGGYHDGVPWAWRAGR